MNKQNTLKTVAGCGFHDAGTADKQQMLLAVNPGVDVVAALQEASNLISVGASHAYEIGMGNGEALPDNFGWAAHHALGTANAIVESVMAALQKAQIKG